MNKGRKNLLVKLLSIFKLMILVLCIPVSTKASSKYISVEDYAEELAKELKLAPVDGEYSGYVNALIEKGIIKDGDFKSYKSDLTRGDCMVLINRADEYLYGDNLEKDLVQLVIDKRISDIGKAKKSKREDIAKAYLKGYIKGFSNGKYSTDRTLKVNGKFVAKDALNCIKMLRNESLRAKISPDGQLIRTTNLPKNADLFPYILASYPNEFYEWELRYQTVDRLNNGKKEMVNLIDYASPADIDKLKIDKYDNFSELRKEKLNEWVDKAKRHLELVFSVDYRTMGEDWFNEMLKTDYQYGTMYQFFPERKLRQYMERMIPNKTIVEYDTLAVDGSTLYYYDKNFYMRVYAKYRIVSSEDTSIPDGNTPFNKRSFEKIMYSKAYSLLGSFKLGEWKEGYYDIILGDHHWDGNIGVLSIEYDCYDGKRIK